MIQFIYPFIGFLLTFCFVTILYKIFKKDNVYSLSVGLIGGLVYLCVLFYNGYTFIGKKDIVDKTGKKCLVTIPNIYDEYNKWNRYDPFFKIPDNILKPDNCESVEYCYKRTPTFVELVECQKNKDYLITK